MRAPEFLGWLQGLCDLVDAKAFIEAGQRVPATSLHLYAQPEADRENAFHAG